MIEYSLLDKIKNVFSLIVKSPLFLILIFGVLLMVIDIVFISKKDKKTKIIYAIVSLLIIILGTFSYLESVLNIFDIIAKNIVSIIYFPTVLEYIIIVLITLIILIISLLSKKMHKYIKRINLFVFIISSFLFFLILDQISKNKIDLSNKIDIYSNSNLMMLLELSILIFVIWIIGLSLYKIIKILTKNNKEPFLESIRKFYDEPILPDKFEDLKKNDPKIEYVIIEKKNDNDMFTLKEYKQMRALLETMKEKEETKK